MQISENVENLKMRKEKNLVYYTEKEEIFNVATHLVGVILGLASFALIAFANSFNAVLSCVITSLGLTIPYAFSTIYHGTKNIYKKSVWRKVDHSGICFIILACGAPLCLNMTIHIYDYIALGLGVAICAANIVMCVYDFKRLARVALILDFVCVAVMLVVYFINRTTVPALSKLFYIIGSVFCLGGAIFYGRKRIYLHTVFHALMLFATTSYFVAALFIVL